MAATSFLRAFFLSYFSQPKSDRALFRAISGIKPQRIVELGMAAGDRAIELIELAQRQRPTVEIRYTGLDLFDARPADSPDGELKIKEIHQELKATGAKIKLVPGDPLSSLSRVANELASTDLLVISADPTTPPVLRVENSENSTEADGHQPDSTAAQPDWFFVPRMLHEHSAVFWQTECDGAFQQLDLKAVSELAAAPRRKAAA